MEEIRDKMIAELQTLLGGYPEVKVRYEYSKKHNAYLVSYIVPSYIGEESPFWDEIGGVEECLNLLFGDSAPLFSEEGRLFSLSPAAVSILSPASVQPDHTRPPLRRLRKLIQGQKGGQPQWT